MMARYILYGIFVLIGLIVASYGFYTNGFSIIHIRVTILIPLTILVTESFARRRKFEQNK